MRSLAALTVIISHSATARGFAPRRGLSPAALRTECRPACAAAPRGAVLGVARGGAGLSIAPAWGALGMAAVLANAIRRVLPVALEPFAGGAAALPPQTWAAYAAFVVFMAYVEGYKAFHLKFSPMVVARALTLRDAPPLHALFAPLYSMGLFHASRKRLCTSWGFLVGIAAVVKLVKSLEYPWRAVVDGGVVAGLSVGAASILYHYGRALGGIDPPADAALP
jgi:hypothetical protein